MKDLKEELKLFPELFFDLLGYFLPGYIFFILFIHSKKFIFINDFMKTLNFWEIALISIITGYIVGHLLTTLSSIILVKPLNLLLGNPVHTLIGVEKPLIDKLSPKLEVSLQQKIADNIKIKFGREIDKHSFFLCENYIRNNNKELGFLIRKRHAFEHLFRNLLISEVILLYFIDFTGVTFWLWYIMIAITLLRYLDYRVSWPKVVYENFYILIGKESDNVKDRAL